MPDSREELDLFWGEFCKLIKKKYNLIDNIMSLWFNEAVLTSLNEDEAVITVKTNFKRSILENNFRDKIYDTFLDMLGSPLKKVTVKSIEAENAAKNPKRPATIEELKTLRREMEPITTESDKIATVGGGSRIAVPEAFREYTFENFVVGKSNELAAGTAKRIADEPAKVYNPFFIYGPSGLGKTHLLYAIAGRLHQNFPEAKVVYVKGEEFTNQLISSLTKGQNAEFRAKYRSADVLLIDDIQFIAGKKSTQEEFFHTFNELYENGKQIVLASDRSPRDIELLEDRLRTRFESGLTVDINPPDYELRSAIIKIKADKLNMPLDPEVIDYIANSLDNNIRQLEGAVKKLSAQMLLTGNDISMDMVINCISDRVKAAEPQKVTAEKIINVVCENFGVTRGELNSETRTDRLAKARHVAFYLIKNYTGMSLPAIGAMFHRGHPAVVNGIDRVKENISKDPSYADKIKLIEKQLRN